MLPAGISAKNMFTEHKHHRNKTERTHFETTSLNNQTFGENNCRRQIGHGIVRRRLIPGRRIISPNGKRKWGNTRDEVSKRWVVMTIEAHRDTIFETLVEFAKHTDNDRWPVDHEAYDLPKDGGTVFLVSGSVHERCGRNSLTIVRLTGRNSSGFSNLERNYSSTNNLV